MNFLFKPFNSRLCFLLSLLAVSSRLVAAPAPGDIVGESLVYKKVGKVDLHLYVVKPANWRPTDHRPAMVFIHGGGWVTGSVAQFNDQAKYLASRGMVCVQVEYRLLAQTNHNPPTICCEDAKSAMRYVRSHAGELGIDPDRIGAAGGSAGGQLAAFTALVPGQDDPHDDLSVSPKPDALVLFFPVLDNGTNGGWGNRRVGDRVKEFSPVANVTSNAPPTIIFLGTKDQLIPVSTIKRFQRHMQACGVRCEVQLYDGCGHGFANTQPYKTDTLIQTDTFLESLGWLRGPPTVQRIPLHQ